MMQIVDNAAATIRLIETPFWSTKAEGPDVDASDPSLAKKLAAHITLIRSVI